MYSTQIHEVELLQNDEMYKKQRKHPFKGAFSYVRSA